MSEQTPVSVPILIILFNRPETTKILLEALDKVKPQKIYVIADGARDNKIGEKEKCLAVRNLVDAINWPCIANKKYFDENHGCDPTVEAGLKWLFENEEQGIILEDDCIPDPTFFSFVTKILEKYKNDTHIMHINGSNFQSDKIYGNGSYYFSRYAHSWGWATWRRAWNFYDHNLKSFPKFKENKEIEKIVKNPIEQKFWLGFFRKLYNKKFPFWVHLHVATDDQDYFAAIGSVMAKDIRFTAVPPFQPAEEERTDFELLHSRSNRIIGRCSYMKREIDDGR